MTIAKEHREFHELDLVTGWRTPAGYPNGIEEKILAGETRREGQDRQSHAIAAV